MKKSFLLTVLAVCLMAAFAHEYILLAAKYRLAKGDDLELHLFVADGFNIEMERPFQKEKTKAFELLTTAGVVDLKTADNALPIVNRKVDFDGGGLVHLERDYSRIELATAKFLDYLKEDHMPYILPKVDRSKAAQKERYSRYIKCLVQSGNTYTDTLYKTITGQAFEIVLLQNPYTLKKGAALKAQVFFNGKPLTGKTITARNRTGSKPATASTAVTNAQGICSFVLAGEGEWFIHATHMIPCPDKTDSDWESFWASYSFAIDKP